MIVRITVYKEPLFSAELEVSIVVQEYKYNDYENDNDGNASATSNTTKEVLVITSSLCVQKLVVIDQY